MFVGKGLGTNMGPEGWVIGGSDETLGEIVLEELLDDEELLELCERLIDSGGKPPIRFELELKGSAPRDSASF